MQDRELQVLGPEVVAPLRDAMRLVDGEEGDARPRQQLEAAPRREPLAPTPDGREFRDWAWIDPAELVDRVVEFRRAPYRQVLGG